MQQFILYQAYGADRYINECRYALLKYLSVYNLKPPAGTAIVIYTDQPARFESFTSFFHRFEMRTVSPEQWKKWRGTIDFVHRAKIELMKDFFRHYSGNLLYCDTDTYAAAPPDELFQHLTNNAFVMHQYEGILADEANPTFRKWNQFLQGKQFYFSDKKMEYTAGLKMWNAGVVGLNSHNAAVLDDVLALTDVVYPQFSKHTVEQFAFSYCFQKSGGVKEAGNIIRHYWNLKEFSALLQRFFQKNEEESIPNLLKAVHHLDAAAIQREKQQFEQMPFYKRWFSAVRGKGWNIRQYQKRF